MVAKMMYASTALVVFLVATIGMIEANDPSKRQVKFDFNPDCNRPECKGTGVNGTVSNIVLVTAENDENTIFYVVSNIGVPTLLMLKTRPNTHISLDWDKLLNDSSAEFTNNSITVNPPDNILYSSALVFTRLIEYNDTADVANMSHYSWNDTEWREHKFSELSWKLASHGDDPSSLVLNATVMAPVNRTGNMSAEELEFGMEEEDAPMPKPLGYVQFVFHMHGDSGRAKDLPHMMHGDNNTQLDFTVAFNATFLMSRFALETALFSNNQETKAGVVEVTSLDDEYTPGIFRTMNWLTAKDNDAKQADSAYLQWRRVSYQELNRTRAVATGVSTSDPMPVTSISEQLKSCLAYAMFKEALKTMTSSALNISFGLSQDGTFAKTNVTSWAALYGIGVPFSDTMSILVISIISVGLGLPVLIIIIGTIWQACRSRSSSSSPYQVINGDVSPSAYAPAINT